MRKFFMENETGARWDLNGKTGVWISNPEGLGVNLNNESSDLENGFFKSTGSKAEPQGNVVADIVFVKKAYETYRSFLNWISAARELVLIYSPYEPLEFYRRVELQYLTKGELGAGKWLTTPISLPCLTPWYLPTALRIALTKQTETAMRYPFTYNADLRYGTSSIGSYTADITPDGHLPASLRFVYKGAAKNPVITLTGAASGKVYGKCIITAELSAEDRIELFTSPRDGYIRMISADGTEKDLIDTNAVDVTEDPFLRIPLEESCHLSLNADEALSGSAEVQIFFYFRSV